MKRTFQPAIKWSGSKRSQSVEILKHFPSEIGTYYEPFCGGCSVLRALLDSGITAAHFVCSDINADLINLWNEIKVNPNAVHSTYEEHWHNLNDKDDDKERKRAYFETVRERLNNEHNPHDFFFIMRTTTNGMPRYNRNGMFNNSFHITRDGIHPEKVLPILLEWSEKLRENDVEFIARDYSVINPSENDFLYLDPPYANTKGMYFGGFDSERMFSWLRGLKCRWALSYDGISGENDCTYDVPRDIYSKHVYIKSGNSSFRRVIGNSKDSIVYESLYLS